jgi:hypothetical protein
MAFRTSQSVHFLTDYLVLNVVYLNTESIQQSSMVALQQFMSCIFFYYRLLNTKRGYYKENKKKVKKIRNSKRVPLQKQIQSLGGTDYYDPKAPSQTC